MISPRQQDDISKADLRRRLVQQWAGMTQEERDDFQRRAPVRKEHVWYPKQFRGTTRQPTSMINLVVPQPMDARNCALWTKLRIMLYHLDGDDGFIFDEPNGEPTIPDLEPSNASPLTADNFFHRQYLEGADFDHIAMTSTGTVICHSYQETLLLADQEALDTGLMLLARVENNGQVVCSGRVWPVMMAETYLGTQNSVDEILDRDTFSQDRLRHMRYVYLYTRELRLY